MIPLPRALLRTLEPMRGKVLRLELAGLRAGPQFTLAGDCLVPVPFGAADVTVRASLRDYVALALRRADPDSLFFARRLVIEGDTALGLAIKNALDSRAG
ncbi:MAG TPA: SCP2 sterol-binding domain-containing protein [Burkholderiales bacterium]|nr:SCP2 sterol-binding domain-containing protein [Burkholderiales bacterium]